MTLTFKESVRAGQLLERQGDPGLEPLTAEELLELQELERRAKLEALPPELADDPSTPLVDETSRPKLSGGDYFRDELKRDVRETAEDVGRAAGKGLLAVLGEFLKGLFTRR